jgi:hypothetical protein
LHGLHLFLASLRGASSGKSGGGGASFGEVTVLCLSVAVGIVGLAKGVIDYRQARRREPLPEKRPDSLPILSVTTAAGEVSNQWSLNTWRLTALGYVLLGGALGGGAYFWLLTRAHSALAVLTGALVGMEGAFIGLMGGWLFFELRGKKEGEPIDRCAAELVVKGNHESVVALCRRALLALEAIRREHSSPRRTVGCAGDRPTRLAFPLQGFVDACRRC